MIGRTYDYDELAGQMRHDARLEEIHEVTVTLPVGWSFDAVVLDDLKAGCYEQVEAWCAANGLDMDNLNTGIIECQDDDGRATAVGVRWALILGKGDPFAPSEWTWSARIEHWLTVLGASRQVRRPGRIVARPADGIASVTALPVDGVAHRALFGTGTPPPIAGPDFSGFS
jgi:hypothetical protein